MRSSPYTENCHLSSGPSALDFMQSTVNLHYIRMECFTVLLTESARERLDAHPLIECAAPTGLSANTCWLLGAGASLDCIGNDRQCVSITRDLFRSEWGLAKAQSAATSDLVSDLFAQAKLPLTAELLTTHLEATIDVVRGLCAHDDRSIAEKARGCLQRIIDEIANSIRKDSWKALLAHGGIRGFQYCAENYLWLAAQCTANDDWSVLTLNYDRVLDRAFEELVSLGVEVHGSEAWASTIGALQTQLSSIQQTGIYLKLHGSLDVTYCLNEACASYRTPVPERPYPNGAHGDAEIIKVDPSHHSKCKTCGSDAFDFVLPPGRNKTRSEALFVDRAYSMATEALAQADTWVTVGYSFPLYRRGRGHSVE